ncbi:MAG: cytochrome P450 [Chloroflexota bacterium]
MNSLTARKARLSLSEVAKGFRVDPIGIMTQLQHEYGDFIMIQVMPGLVNYVIFSPELAYDILVKRPEQFQKPVLAKRMLKSSFGNGIFFSEGTFWRRQRKLAQPAFNHARIHVYANDMVANTQKMLERWQTNPQIDLAKEMHALTLVIVVNALFKTDISGLTDTIGQAMGELTAVAGEQATSMLHLMLPSWLPTSINQRKQRAVDILNPIIYKLLADQRASTVDKGDLLSMFLQAVDEETGERMTDLQVRDELMTMFIAGHDTSANALAWTLVELARHPEIEAKLHAEVDSVLGGRAPQLSDVPLLPYTQNVIKEALRMYPPAVFIARQPLSPLHIGASSVPKTALINIIPYMIQRDSRWFDDPNSFNPDRFTADFEKQLPKCTYFPFGAGPRICIGNGFAMLEMQLVLATIVQRYQLSFVPGQAPVEPKFDLTLGFKQTVRMQIAERIPVAG